MARATDEAGDRRVSTGVDRLDTMLGGGYPAERTVLVTGDSGTGKSTLGMAFLQAGVDAGEHCVYVATEQTIGAVRDSFADQPYDVDADGLSILSSQATVAEFLDDEERSAEEIVYRLLDDYAPCDRLVFDGLVALAEESGAAPRRLARDLARTATEELDATALIVAEGAGAGAGVDPATDVEGAAFGAHGVLRLWNARVDGDRHRFLRVAKLRASAHDRRAVEVQIDGDGLSLGPERRSPPAALTDCDTLPTGVSGLDALCGGGLSRGSGVLLEHDGRCNLGPVFATLLAGALQRGSVVELVPTIHLRPDRLRALLAGYGFDLDELLADDRLFVFDMIGAWEAGRQNVFGAREELPEVQSMLSGIADRTDGPHFRLVNAGAMAHALDAPDARELRYFQEASLLGPEDQLVHVQHPDACPDELVAVYRDAADQVLRWRARGDGLQYVSLEKSPGGAVGATSLVSFREEPPYLAVADPPTGAGGDTDA